MGAGIHEIQIQEGHIFWLWVCVSPSVHVALLHTYICLYTAAISVGLFQCGLSDKLLMIASHNVCQPALHE